MPEVWRSPWLSVIDEPPTEPFFAAKDEVLVIAIDSDNQLLLIEEPSPAFGQPALLLPGGTIEEGETPEESAQRELREETGFAAAALTPLQSLRPWTKYLRLTTHVVFATELSASPLEPDETHAVVLHRKVRKDVEALIGSGDLCDARVIAALSISPWWR